MAYTTANMVWEVQPTSGNDANGGGWDAASTGADKTQSAPVVFDGATVKLTAAGSSATATVTGYTVLATDVGNLVNITGGTNATTGRRRIASVNTGTGTWTFDTNWCSGACSNGAARAFGPLQTIAAVAAIYVASNKIFVKAEATIQTAATITFATGGTPKYNAPYTKIIGYSSTRGDGGQVTVQLITNSTLTALKATGQGIGFESFNVDCNGLTASTGIDISAANYCYARFCKVANAKTYGINAANGTAGTYSCELTGCYAGAYAIKSSGAVVGCFVHDNACTGIRGDQNGKVLCNLIDNNTGSTSDGIETFNDVLVMHNTINRCGRHGIYCSGGYILGTDIWLSNIISNVGLNASAGTAYCICNSGAGFAASPFYDGNAFFVGAASGAAGTRRYIDDAGATYAINGIAPYTNTRDVTLTVDPFVTTGNFNLNATAGGGAACFRTAPFSSWPGATATGYADYGAVQAAFLPALLNGGLLQ